MKFLYFLTLIGSSIGHVIDLEELSHTVYYDNRIVPAEPMPKPIQLIDDLLQKGQKPLGKFQESIGLAKLYTSADAEGNTFHKYDDQEHTVGRTTRVRQEHSGLEVFGYEVAIYQVNTKAIKAKTFNGMMIHGLRGLVKSGDAQRMAEGAKEVLRKVKRGEERDAFFPYNHRLDLDDRVRPIIYVDAETKGATKGYFVQYAPEYSRQPSYLAVITDENGNIIKQWEDLKTCRRLKPKGKGNPAKGSGPGGNRNFGKKYYNEELDITHYENDICTLENKIVRTENHKWTWFFKTDPHAFKCYNQKSHKVNGAYSPMNDAHYYGSQTYLMYKTYYDASPVEKLPIVMRVHYGFFYENAFFDGTSVTFGDGLWTFHPLTSLGIVAHEVSHAVTRRTSSLAYDGMSGGMNEAFSDMAAKTAEAFLWGYDKKTFNWGIGFAAVKKGKKVLRCMDNPPCDGISIDDVRDYVTQGVHQTSGVYNKVFYLLSTQLKNNLKDAFDIMYIANTRYWTQTTTFYTGAQLVLKAIVHLKKGMHLPNNNYDHVDINAVIEVFKQVGISCKKDGNTTDDKYKCEKMGK